MGTWELGSETWVQGSTRTIQFNCKLKFCGNLSENEMKLATLWQLLSCGLFRETNEKAFKMSTRPQNIVCKMVEKGVQSQSVYGWMCVGVFECE